ncbi:MAG: SGNH/GDSL hydrolase family protein [Butyrivibrio sp.]|nr:SGNH/GDSL hydrolase family protein [Muribaculum sp.]MCM1551693.1 SGNH/GDSL hydrolase family protein [Butyrivibrio sp.]
MNSANIFIKIFRKIIYIVPAVLIFALLLVFTFPNRQKGLARTEYPVVVLGDSIMGQCRDETSVTALLSDMLERPVFNGAFGGTCMSLQEDGTSSDYATELLNMVSISKAIAADDFGVQQTVRSRRDISDYYVDVVDELECVDFQQVEILILAFGLNDYHAGVPVDNLSDPLDESTYGGALRSVLTALRQNYPDMRILLVTPTYTWYRSNKLTCEEYDTGSVYLEEYVEKELAVAAELQVEAVDLYHDVYPHTEWVDWKVYTEDGLHPNEDGRRLIAELIRNRIEED